MNEAQRTLLAAYHDGELDAAGKRSVRELISSNVQAREYLNELDSLDERLRASLDPILRQPLPEGLRRVQQRCMENERKPLFAPLALAASLLLLAVSAMYFGDVVRLPDSSPNLQRQIVELRHRTLEHVPSGTPASWVEPSGAVRVEITPVQTYRASDNRYCRAYEERVEDADGVEIRRGIACREGKAKWPERGTVNL